LPDKLGRLMSDFQVLIRRYKNQHMLQLDAAAGLSERDLAILELVDEKGQASFAEVAKALDMSEIGRKSASTISQTISALYAQRGLVEKRPNPDDQRQPIITLTAQGKAIVEKVKEVRRTILAEVKSAMELSERDASILEAAFARGIMNFEKLLSEK